MAALREQVSVPLKIIPLDLTKEESFATYDAILSAENPNIKLLVNAAGFGKFGSFKKIPLEDELKMIDLNCKALLAITRLTLPYMRSGSHILQLDSLSAFQPVPYITTYGATKAFVLSYCRAMNAELKPQGIRMMAMNPGWVKTEFFHHAFQTNEGEVQYFDRLYEAKDVVATGLKDLYRSKKDYSVHGLPVQMQVRLVKLLPHSMVMSTWLKQQKKAKNNKDLTTKS
jgi:short-subunit dehydrogenase